MMEKLKNSVFSKVLQVLLIGYFLISSINLSNSPGRVTQDTCVYKKESTVWAVFKKMLKCNGNAEEYDDCDNEPGTSSNKVKLTTDYLLPFHAGVMPCLSYTATQNKIYLTQPDFNGSLYTKIHLPPPEFTL